MPHMHYLLRDEAYQRRVDRIAPNALELARRANERWDRIFDEGGNAILNSYMAHFLTLNRLAGKTLGRGGIAEFSPTITDGLSMPTDIEGV